MKIRLFLLFISIFVFSGCQKPVAKYIYNKGIIHGAPYLIVYENPEGKDMQAEIDTLLKNYNMIFSVYEKESVISKVNNNEDVTLASEFIACFNKAMEISQISDGAFDITCGPMVNAWGFGPEDKKKMTQEKVDSLKILTGYHKVKIENGKVIKENLNMKLDMNALCDGYFCDLICEFLQQKGCKNFMTEIGGEVKAQGKNEKGNIWTIGINKPVDENVFVNNEIQAKVHLENKALATSGNYRNFYVEDGKKYAHTIDPKTGYPVQHSLLSATVITQDGMTADGFATTFMVMGLEKSIELSKQMPELEVYFIYADEKGNNKIYMSENFKQRLVE
ncbi:MAG TPA: FAD:protein FMN transferase [Draconibacterium sp.]|nr:FAD:protein FMN transferase [Draconibacterium sp.]